ncbi:hypothetical protein DY000_02032349 [Brassica cretica]|uniref:Uncharacterized protein n=1 Tax=Brassica cretica TaxID=69181 RepID=A0ABQ7DBG4_BRACR|nr:hypothetical protein DY000_02032349 [Brassica cretica]
MHFKSDATWISCKVNTVTLCLATECLFRLNLAGTMASTGMAKSMASLCVTRSERKNHSSPLRLDSEEEEEESITSSMKFEPRRFGVLF